LIVNPDRWSRDRQNTRSPSTVRVWTVTDSGPRRWWPHAASSSWVSRSKVDQTAELWCTYGLLL